MLRRVFIFCLFLFSCSGSKMIETELYFGQSKPGGGLITEAEWSRFKENYISKVFKEGSTVINATGNWFDPEKDSIITEPTYKLTYFYKASKKISEQIDSLRFWYKTIFHQQSVLRVDKKVKAVF